MSMSPTDPTLARRLLALACALAFTAAAGAQSAPSAYWNYEVRAGDTLSAIAERYLERASSWLGVARDNGIARPRLLAPGSTVSLPVDRMRHDRLQARVAYLRGGASVRHVRDAAGQPLAVGDELGEGDVIEVAPDGFATLTLPDASRLLLAAGTRLRLQSLRDLPDADRSLADFVLEAGHVQADVQHQRPGSRFEVKTPAAITGVRGTQFGVAVGAHGEQIGDVTQGVVAVATARHPAQSAPVAAGEGIVVVAGTAERPTVRALLPAPDVSGWPARIDTSSWTAPAPADAPTGIGGYVVSAALQARPDAVAFDGAAADIRLGPVPDGLYSVAVRALDADRVPGLIASRTLRVKTQPAAPFLQTPPDGRFVGRESQALVCTDVAGVERYLLQVARDAQFTQGVETRTATGSCRFAFIPPEDGAYYWRAAAMDPQPADDPETARGPWSVPGSFRVAPRPVAPEPESENRGDAVAIRWAPGADGERFLLQVAGAADFGTLVSQLETDQPAATLTLPPSCTPYFVRMQTIAPHDLRSDFSPARILKTPQPLCTQGGATVQGPDGLVRMEN